MSDAQVRKKGTPWQKRAIFILIPLINKLKLP